MVRFKLKDLQRKEDEENERKERSNRDIELLFSKAPLEQCHIGDESADGLHTDGKTVPS